MKQEKLNFGESKDFLSLPTNILLEEYGKGSHVPGSGSASALSALFGIEMMKTVAKLTLQKDTYQKEHTNMEFILSELEKKYKPKLIDLFQKDIKVFHQVSTYRRQRDSSNSEKQKKVFSKKAINQLKVATEIPMQICQISLELVELAISIFDRGFKSARGDSGVAISNLLSAISGSLFVIFLNLKSFYKSKWLNETRKRAEELARKYNYYQAISFDKVLELYESLEDSNKQLKFEFFAE